MEESYSIKYHALEETHWWFKGRRDMLYSLLKIFRRSSQILEVGCSGGPLLSFLKQKGFQHIYGIDVSERAIDICKNKGLENTVLGDGSRTEFQDNNFDLLIASDVLEHLQDENTALREWNRILKPKGTMIIFVPAFHFLWSTHDEANLHYRRYTKSYLTTLLEKNGFETVRSSYWNCMLFFPAFLVRTAKRFLNMRKKDTEGQLYSTNAFFNTLIEQIIKMENRILSTGLNLPVGISLFAVARKV